MADELPRTLVVMALPAESAGRFEQQGIPVLYTGVGKVNAAAALARRLAQYRCADRALPLVVNFGTAGSRRHPACALVGCHRFIDRDMDASALGFAPGTTPFDPLPAVLEFAPRFPRLPAAVCGSGDSFAAEAMAVQFDVMDMEAYALAKVCHIEGADFACAKFVSDGADDASARDWQENVAGAADAFVALYRELVSCP
jgi:adenosylhomocysteine nucleosidase